MYEQRLDLPAGCVRQARYSQAHKERAVEHHRDHGRCIAATIKALGYPSRSLLSAWIQELSPQARAPVGGRPQELTPEAKQSAVIALCMRPASAQAVADDVGVSRGSLCKWKNQLLDHEVTVPMKRQQDAPPGSDRAELEQPLETLRRDVRRLQLERDVLKKASELIKKELGIDRPPLTNREKAQLVDARRLRQTYTLAELLCEVDLPRNSYFYQRARLQVADKYAEVRVASRRNVTGDVVVVVPGFLQFHSSSRAVGMWAKAAAVGNAAAQRRVVHGRCRCAARRIVHMSIAPPGAQRPAPSLWDANLAHAGY